MPKLTVLVMSQDHNDPGPVCLVYNLLKNLEISENKSKLMMLKETANDITVEALIDEPYNDWIYARNILRLILRFEETGKALTEKDLEDSLLLNYSDPEIYKPVLKDINDKKYQNPYHPLYQNVICRYAVSFQEGRLYNNVQKSRSIPVFGIDYSRHVRTEISKKIETIYKRRENFIAYMVSLEPMRLKHMVDTTMLRIQPLLETGGIVLVNNMGLQHCHPYTYHLHKALQQYNSSPENTLEIQIIPMHIRTTTLIAKQCPLLKKAYEITYAELFPDVDQTQRQHLKTDTTEMKKFYQANPLRTFNCTQDPTQDANFLCPEFNELVVSLRLFTHEEKMHVQDSFFNPVENSKKNLWVVRRNN